MRSGQPIFGISFKHYTIMKMLKVIEVLANSKLSWEDAAKQAVERAGKSLHNIRSIYICDHNASVENNKIIEYRINAKITFELEE